MTDLEKFIELYKSFGIELQKTMNENNQWVINMEAGDHEKIKGWIGFFTYIIFDEKGKFIEQGFKE
jgi:hypothetical protein